MEVTTSLPMQSGMWTGVIVGISVLLSMFGAYIFLGFIERIALAHKQSKLAWGAGASVASAVVLASASWTFVRGVSEASSRSPYILIGAFAFVSFSCATTFFVCSQPQPPVIWRRTAEVFFALAIPVWSVGVWIALGLFHAHDIAGIPLLFLWSGTLIASYVAQRVFALVGRKFSYYGLGRFWAAIGLGLLWMLESIACLLVLHPQLLNTEYVASLPYRFHLEEVSLLLLCNMIVIAAALITMELDKRVGKFALALQEQVDQKRISQVLSEQRVIALHHDALLEEIRERKRIESELSFAAFHDSLTGLHNRAYLMEVLANVLSVNGHRQLSRSVLVYIDLDNFKTVNDMLGHRAGDLLLVEISRRLEKCIRDKDSIVRMGGDEFTILLASTHTVEQAMRVAQRILTVIEEPILVSGMELPMTASLGLCEITESYANTEEILRDADTAMYVAKRSGGAQCMLYDASMHEDALATMQAKLQLKAAIENREFELYYQPLIDMRDRSIYGMEGLIRWNHPTRGLVSPGLFIPLAEETGDILAVGTWVLQQACEDLKQLREASDRPLLMTLNVSTRQLDEPDFVDSLRKLFEKTGANPSELQLEITESIFLKDAARMGMLFHEIRSLGIKIAFDDFGTGYSSLSYLERYPVDTIKIDQSFVRRMTNRTLSADIVRFVVELAHAMGASTSAEGVEEEEQRQALVDMGCVHAQGYLFSRPVPLMVMLGMLQKKSELPTALAG